MKENKKLTNTKKVIVGVTVGGIFILLFIFLLAKQSKDIVAKTAQQTTANKEELTKEMEGVQGYLTELEANVLKNQNSLKSIENYNGYTQQLEGLRENISKLEKLVQTYEKAGQAESEKTKQDLVVITEKINDIKENITSIQTELEDIKNDIENNHKQKVESLSKIQSSIDKLEENLRSFYEEIISMIEDLKRENELQQKELLEMLKQVESILSELIESELEELLTVLSQQIQEGVLGLQIQLEKDVTYLSKKMSDLHEKIVTAQTTITQLLENLSKEQSEVIQKGFQGVQNSLEEITLEFRETHEEIKKLIIQVQKTQALNHTEMLTVLDEMESGMEELNIQNFNKLIHTMNQMEQKYDLTMQDFKNEFSQKLTDIDFSISSQLNTINAEMVNQYSNLTSIVNIGDTELKEYLEIMSGELKQKFDSVFLSVSNGKKLLASALLTKGVDCREDATFTEIYKAILAIPQKLVIGVEQIPGTISYDYHYHVDANGNQLHITTNPTNGGCYSVAVFHAHSGDCYTTRNCGGKAEEHTYMTQGCNCGPNAGGGSRCGTHGCYFEPPSAMYPSGCAHCFCPKSKEWVCTVCGGRTGGSVCTNSKTILTCTKTGSTIEHYRIGCGLSDGQIIGAHIIYDQSQSKQMEAIYEEEITIELETVEPIHSSETSSVSNNEVEEVSGEAIDTEKAEDTEESEKAEDTEKSEKAEDTEKNEEVEENIELPTKEKQKSIEEDMEKGEGIFD